MIFRLSMAHILSVTRPLWTKACTLNWWSFSCREARTNEHVKRKRGHHIHSQCRLLNRFKIWSYHQLLHHLSQTQLNSFCTWCSFLFGALERVMIHKAVMDWLYLTLCNLSILIEKISNQTYPGVRCIRVFAILSTNLVWDRVDSTLLTINPSRYVVKVGM